MSLSGSYDFTQNRDSILKDSLRIAGIIDYSEDGDVDAEIITSASRSMNRMFKSWAADGLQCWKQVRCTLYLEKGQRSYDLGSTGANWTTVQSVTAIKTTAVAGATSIDVDNTGIMTVGDDIGIVLDSGYVDWTTVVSITDSDTVVITTGLTSAASVGNWVPVYTDKAQRPHRITLAVHRDSGNTDVELLAISRDEYWGLSDKGVEGVPTQYWYDQLLGNGNLRIYPTPSNSTGFLKVIAHYPFQDMTSSTDNIDFPDYWYEAIIDGLAYRFSVEYRSPPDVRAELKQISAQSKQEAMDFDVEGVSIYFQPERGI